MTRKEFWEWMKTCPIQQVDEPDGFNDEFYHCGWLTSGRFVADDDGNLKMDVTSLPSHLQTMSSDNIASKFTALQSAATQNVQTAEQQQMQLNQMAQQSMMGGALSAALQNEGMMQKVGGGVGTFARTLFTGGR